MHTLYDIIVLKVADTFLSSILLLLIGPLLFLFNNLIVLVNAVLACFNLRRHFILLLNKVSLQLLKLLRFSRYYDFRPLKYCQIWQGYVVRRSLIDSLISKAVFLSNALERASAPSYIRSVLATSFKLAKLLQLRKLLLFQTILRRLNHVQLAGL